MPCRRFYIALAPVAHINGKMAPVRVKCANTNDPAAIETTGFWYGYRRMSRQDVSRYGIRTKCRDLTQHPYTATEIENRALFTLALQAVQLHHEVAGDWELMLIDFHTQERCVTPIGYAVAVCRENNGIWPAKWVAD